MDKQQQMGKVLKIVDTNAKKRDFEKQQEIEEKKRSMLEELNKITGENYYLGTNKDPFSKEPFSQIMHRNLDLLIQINYLTQAEQSFILAIQPYLEFRSNAIVCRDDKFKKRKQSEEDELPRSATVSDIAEMIGKSRQQTSEVMNSLKKKQILLCPDEAGTMTDNGRVVTPRTWIFNPYIAICAPRVNGVKLDRLVMRLFRNSLKNLKDQNGKKVQLPARFF